MSFEDRNSAFAELDLRRMRANGEAKERERELERAIPELVELNRAIASVGPRLLKLGMEGGADYEKKSQELYREHERLVDKKHALLAANGYDEDYDMPVYTCKICKDTGYIDTKLCKCVRDFIVRRAYFNSGLGKALEGQTFDSIDLGYYSGLTEGGVSVKEQMALVLKTCENYAKYFAPGSGSLLMIGDAGRGKTHFASAIARAVIEKGYSVVYECASNIVSNFEAERFGKYVEVDVQKYYNCALLIIDDLGTEFNTQFTLSALFNLINHRIINERSTIVTTNLSMKELKDNYKERIYSRLSGEFSVLPFCGKDIRRIKSGNV